MNLSSYSLLPRVGEPGPLRGTRASGAPDGCGVWDRHEISQNKREASVVRNGRASFLWQSPAEAISFLPRSDVMELVVRWTFSVTEVPVALCPREVIIPELKAHQFLQPRHRHEWITALCCSLSEAPPLNRAGILYVGFTLRLATCQYRQPKAWATAARTLR
jgi:hypothetical protein